MVKNKTIRLTEEQRQMIVEALLDEWNAIADDCFVDGYGRHDESISLKGTAVREIVCDRFFGGCWGGVFDSKVMREASRLFTDISHSQRMKLLKEAFPHKEYGY